MKTIINFIIVILITTFLPTTLVHAQQSVQSNKVCTKVGNSQTPNPCQTRNNCSIDPTSIQVDESPACINSGKGLNPLPFTISCPLSKDNNPADYKITTGSCRYLSTDSYGHGNPYGGYSSCTNLYRSCGALIDCDPNKSSNCIQGNKYLRHSLDIETQIDVVSSQGSSVYKEVYLPFINGTESVSWTHTKIPDDKSWGTGSYWETNYQGKNIKLYFLHLQPNSNNIASGAQVKSGEKVGILWDWVGSSNGSPHLHAGVYIDGQPVETEMEAGMCAREVNMACRSPIKTSPPPPINDSELSQAIKNEFGINLTGDWGKEALRWMYEEFYRIKQEYPKFAEMLNGHRIQACNCSPNQMEGYVQMNQRGAWGTREKFIPTLIHELGHNIVSYNTGSLFTKYQSDWITNGKQVFSAYANGYTQENNRLHENYAEMISYCMTGDGVANNALYPVSVDGKMFSPSKWQFYKPIAEEITGGICQN